MFQKQNNLQKEVFIDFHYSRVLESATIMMENRQVDISIEQLLRTHILIHKHEAERERINWKWHGLLKPQKLTHVNTPSPTTPTLLILPK